jgi:AcrR family transcriptional regulator
MRGVSETPSRRIERRSRQRAANRSAILEAARRVAAREGAGQLSLRAAAGEAGYAPASVYEYFRNRAELVLALAADDLAQIARALREHVNGARGLASAARIVLDLVRHSGALAAAAATLEHDSVTPESERLFTGRLIAALTALADASGRAAPKTRDEQADIVLTAAVIVGLAALLRAGRLKALGFDEQELLERLQARFA